jgi:hypothetical protein
MVLLWSCFGIVSKQIDARVSELLSSCGVAQSSTSRKVFDYFSMLNLSPRSKNTMRTALAISLIAAIGIAVWQLVSHKAPQNVAASQPAPASASVSASAPAHAGKHTHGKHSHAISPALYLDGPEYVEMRSRWFDPPTWTNASPRAFAASSTPLSVDKSCAKRSEMQFASRLVSTPRCPYPWTLSCNR